MNDCILGRHKPKKHRVEKTCEEVNAMADIINSVRMYKKGLTDEQAMKFAAQFIRAGILKALYNEEG